MHVVEVHYFWEIGSRVGRNQKTILRICDRWMQEGTTDRRGRSHPSQCTTSRGDRQIMCMAVTDCSVTSRTITQHIEFVTHHSVSARTNRRCLQQSGLSASGLSAPSLGLSLTQNHRRLHRQWYDERRMWVAEWNEVVFNDESRNCLQHHDSRIRVWRHHGERMLHRHTGPAPGIMVWVSLEEQLASLKLQRKVRSSSPHHHQRSRSRSKSRRRYNPQGRYCFYHFRFGKKCLPGRKFRLFVKDRETGCQFLVDSGADVSILPWTKTKGECQASQYKLYAANGTEIPTYGLKILTLDLGLRRPFQWPFIIAKVERGIIGADFLQKFQLLIDLHNRKLIDGVTNLSIKGEVATIQENNDLSTVNRASKYFNLLKLYPDLTKPNLVNRVVKHEVKHHILTTGQPVYSKARQLAPDKLKLAKQEFQFMLDNDIIRPSKSQWASPLHLVNKKGWHIKTMWRLQATQRTDNTRSISNS
ncbi:transposon Ty3-G Gag-Pol polyprotein [Trichonephila clavipes]|nr:transposon Ty3-G Gag-Pol polyprotein [Trichonephila clavipes]